MTSGKQRGYAFDVDAWIQFHLLRLASFHPKTTKADIAVLAEIIQRYYGKFGNGWVTHETLGEIAGISKSTVIRAKRNLEILGFITVVQSGRRGSATVYKPNFDLVPRKGVTDDTETKGITRATETSGFGSVDDTQTGELGITDDTPSYLPDRPTRAESQIDRDEFAAPGAPPLAGLSAATAGPAKEGGFEELWKAYSCKQKKAEAKAAYAKLAPDRELHARMVEAAGNWFARWAAQEKPDAPRFTLAKWIEREEFECEPPTAYKAKERKHIATPKAAPEPETEREKPDFNVYPDRPASGVIERSEISTDDEDGAVMLSLWFRTTEGEAIEHLIICESPISEEQDSGQKELRLLLDAVGLDDLPAAADLIGHQVDLMLTHYGKFVSCSRPWVSAQSGPRNVPRFVDVVNRTKPGGWALKIGTAYAEDPDAEAA
ncbi:helix-turn-helix domain-containing protein [Rhizobium binae]|uniref:helix-turn-helix domain-containing protein n=1 Tax=Rhizobium binae TaxID=1138190 RepID=UPI001C829E9D|nr:helix-turn-helix domain-containing protein [Rhizobium binae]MBX4967199.1 helix-turn-helix domain-containing protein [Rhizobium binae]